ncbi:mRNA-capping enzyme subunit beta [Dinochytrium kinnereticum]|nr:mRNA-capping enzyme subunit beta [Dinochytrium kinnereticum]
MAHVRLFEKESLDNEYQFSPISGINLGSNNSDTQAFQIPDLSSVRRTSDVFNLKLSFDESQDSVDPEEEKENQTDTSFEVVLKGSPQPQKGGKAVDQQDRRDSVANLFQFSGNDSSPLRNSVVGSESDTEEFSFEVGGETTRSLYKKRDSVAAFFANNLSPAAIRHSSASEYTQMDTDESMELDENDFNAPSINSELDLVPEPEEEIGAAAEQITDMDMSAMEEEDLPTTNEEHLNSSVKDDEVIEEGHPVVGEQIQFTLSQSSSATLKSSQSDFDIVELTPRRRISNVFTDLPIGGPEMDLMQEELDAVESSFLIDEKTKSESISINEFLQAIGMHFIDTLTTSLRRETNAFTRGADPPTQLDFARASCLQTPELRSLEFGCKALAEHIKEGRNSMSQMEDEVLRETPAIFYEFIDSSNESQAKMLQQFKSAKLASRLETKKIWYGWREKIMKPFQEAINENLLECEKDLQDTNAFFEEAQSIFQAGNLILQKVRKTKESVSSRLESVHNADMKNQLLLELQKLNEENAKLRMDCVKANELLSAKKTQLTKMRATHDDEATKRSRERFSMINYTHGWKPIAALAPTSKLNFAFNAMHSISKFEGWQSPYGLCKEGSNLVLRDRRSAADLPKILEANAGLACRVHLLLKDIEDARFDCPIELETDSPGLFNITAYFFMKEARLKCLITFTVNVYENLYPFGKIDWKFRDCYGHLNAEEISDAIGSCEKGYGHLGRLCRTLQALFRVQDQHAGINRILNKLVSDQRGVSYMHLYELDSYYHVGSKKVRVTTNKKTGEVIPGKIIVKQRIADLNILCPMSSLDCRISVNLELPASAPPPNQSSDFQRDKDRLSYVHQAFRIDLTQIADNKNSKKMHELEVEFVDAKTLVAEKRKLDSKQPNQFNEMVAVFVNNIRALSRELSKIR